MHEFSEKLTEKFQYTCYTVDWWNIQPMLILKYIRK